MREPERVDGPTPNGGAYAVGYYDETGHLIEVVEYDADGEQIFRTYNETPPALEPPPPR